MSAKDDLPARIAALLAADDEADDFDRLCYEVMAHFDEQFALAITVFGGVFQAQQFMLEPQPGLDGGVPLEIMAGEDRKGSEEGRRRVMDFLEELYRSSPAFDQPVEEW